MHSRAFAIVIKNAILNDDAVLRAMVSATSWYAYVTDLHSFVASSLADGVAEVRRLLEPLAIQDTVTRKSPWTITFRCYNNANVNRVVASKHGLPGQSPLFVASKHGLVELAMHLCANNADVNQKLPTLVDGCQVPIHAAASEGHLELVIALCKQRADINMAAETGVTALQLAKNNGHVHTEHFLLLAASYESAHSKPFGTIPKIDRISKNMIAIFWARPHRECEIKDWKGGWNKGVIIGRQGQGRQ
jgi:hypothetical protein